jgi:hypothetical protein
MTTSTYIRSSFGNLLSPERKLSDEVAPRRRELGLKVGCRSRDLTLDICEVGG